MVIETTPIEEFNRVSDIKRLYKLDLARIYVACFCTLQDAADKIGVSRSCLSRYRYGSQEVPDEIAEEMLDYLGADAPKITFEVVKQK